jgi:hypothetical protein
MSGQGTKRAAAPPGSREAAKSAGTYTGGSTPPADANSGTARTTAILPTALNENWEAYALREGLAKNQVLVQALSEFLREKGLQPDRRPRTIEIIY